MLTSLANIAEQTQGLVPYVGSPDWMTVGLLEALAAEADRLKESAIRIERQTHSPVGDVGLGVATSDDVIGFASDWLGCCVRPSGRANYLFYEGPGGGIDPHRDSPAFPYQILLMLSHCGHDGLGSTLVVFPDGPASAIRVPLEPGELALFCAGSIDHARSTLATGETLQLLGVGFIDH